MGENAFFLMVSGRIYGPFTRSQIQQAHSKGALPSTALVSVDKRQWIPLTRFLTGAEPSPVVPAARTPAPPVPVAPSAATAQPGLQDEKSGGALANVILVVGAALAGIAVLTLIVVLLVNLGRSRQIAENKAAPSQTASSSSQQSAPGVQGPNNVGTTSDGSGTVPSQPQQPAKPAANTAGVGRSRQAGRAQSGQNGGLTGQQPPTLSMDELTKRLELATVEIRTDLGQGSGFFLENARYPNLVVTNYHVVEDALQILVATKSGMYRVTHVALFPECDLAFLLPQGITPQVRLSLRSERPTLGEDVLAYGSPLGLSGSLTKGCVSSFRTTGEIEAALGYSLEPYAEQVVWVQTTAAINPGNSGGPLVDMWGRVVGVNTLRGLETPNGQPLQGFNFALASEEISRRLQTASLEPFVPAAALAQRQLALLREAMKQRFVATYRFWLDMKVAMKRFDETLQYTKALDEQNSDDPAAALQHLAVDALAADVAANYIESLDNSFVDEEAVLAQEAVLAFLVSFQRMAEDIIDAASWQSGYFLQQTIAQILARTELEMTVAIGQVEAARKVLSLRYGVEFPPLFGED